MRVLAIVTTNGRNGLASRMCERVLEGAAENGHQTRLINLYDYRICWCTGCWACAEVGKCVMSSLKNIVSISCGTNHALALAENGDLWPWGWNIIGQLGDRSF